ncbi:MAG: J domain-containing protein [Actinomycetota bacterium]|nr:J domain-containing protein [Actinomycetota bacterium]
MLLAELQIWHTRPVTPTRRVALGHLVLPTDPAPGLGGVLLAAVVAAYLPAVDQDLVPDINRLIDQVARGERVVQPRLQHRYQVDRHGLATSVHQLTGDADHVSFDLHSMGRPLSQVLGAVYALERLSFDARRHVAPVLHRAMRWHGPIGPSFVADITGVSRSDLVGIADPRAWALDLLGFPMGTGKLTKKDVMARYRDRLREAHPDHGGDDANAGYAIEQLGEARRILLQL